MAAIFDISAQLAPGDPELTDNEKKSWIDFYNSTYASALREFIYVIRHHMMNSNKTYGIHLEILYDEIYCHLHSNVSSTDVLPSLKRTISEDRLYYWNEGLLMESCFQFAIFYLCREYANISRYFQSMFFSDASVKEKLFPKSDFRVYQNIETNNTFRKLLSYRTINKTYKQMKKISLKNGIPKNELMDSYKDNLAKMFSPLCKLKVFFDELSEIIIDDREQKNFFDEFNLCNNEILNEIAGFMFRCITADKLTYRHSYTFAVGNGLDSIGFMDINNLGLMIFNYEYAINEDNDEYTIQNNTLKNVDKKIKNNDIIHLYSFGFDYDEISNISLFIGNNTFKFEGSKLFYNGIRPVRDNTTFPSYYEYSVSSEIETKEMVVTRYGKITDFGGNKASFNRISNNLEILDISDEESIKVALAASNRDSDYEEFFLMMNIVQTTSKSITLELFDYFEDNRFEIKKSKANSIFSNIENSEKFHQIIDFLSTTQSPTIYTSIKGRYVGIIKNGETIARQDIEPIAVNGKCEEQTTPQNGDKYLRYSNVSISLNIANKTLAIEIWSTTSPFRSRLDNDLIPAYLNENGDNIDSSVLEALNDKYTNSHKILVEGGKLIPIYNQPLAMLRSMGVLEAIAKQIIKNTTNNVEVVQEAMNKMMNNAIAEDESWEIRGKIGENYQVPNGINYETYRRFKWYKNCDEYELYDHSINFNEN